GGPASGGRAPRRRPGPTGPRGPRRARRSARPPPPAPAPARRTRRAGRGRRPHPAGRGPGRRRPASGRRPSPTAPRGSRGPPASARPPPAGPARFRRPPGRAPPARSPPPGRRRPGAAEARAAGPSPPPGPPRRPGRRRGRAAPPRTAPPGRPTPPGCQTPPGGQTWSGSSASRSPASSSASSSSAASAPSPSAERTTSVPWAAPRDSTPRMLLAGTGARSPARMDTGTGCCAARCTKIFAGRACSPCAEPMMTVRSGTAASFGWGLAFGSGFDRHLDRDAPGDEVEGVVHGVQGEAVGDEVVHRHLPGADELQRAGVVGGAGPVGADQGQLLVVDAVGVDGDDRVVLGQPAEQADPAPGRDEALRLLLRRARRGRGDRDVRAAAAGELADLLHHVGRPAVDRRLGLDERRGPGEPLGVDL